MAVKLKKKATELLKKKTAAKTKRVAKKPEQENLIENEKVQKRYEQYDIKVFRDNAVDADTVPFTVEVGEEGTEAFFSNSYDTAELAKDVAWSLYLIGKKNFLAGKARASEEAES